MLEIVWDWNAVHERLNLQGRRPNSFHLVLASFVNFILLLFVFPLVVLRDLYSTVFHFDLVAISN